MPKHVSAVEDDAFVRTGGEQSPLVEELINVLQRESDVRQKIKEQLAAASGLASSSITDENLYSRVRQEVGVRALAISELNAIGYEFNLDRASGVGEAGTGKQSNIGRQPERYQDPNDSQANKIDNPYKNLPSLNDLYAQFPKSIKNLRRFGSEAFQVSSGKSTDMSTDLPIGPDYVLGTGDSITINMWGGQSEQLSRVIDRQGRVELPEAGMIVISGMTISQAQQEVQKALASQFQGERAEISLGKVRSVRIYVVGDVQRPGAYDVSSLSTPLSALFAAGGPTSRGSLRILRQYRGGQLVRQFDLYDFWIKGVRDINDRLLPGDTILVPPVGPLVSVEGMVRRPAIYELNGEQSLDQVLDLAGGVLVSANLKQINVERIEAHQIRTMLNLDLSNNDAEAKQKLSSFAIKDGDEVVLTQIAPYNSQAVYLEGHVLHPGRYPYHEGMKVNDLLHSYQDLMPEPSEHVELTRLLPPDFHPETTSLNLSDLMIGNDSLSLQPFDLLRVFGRYEVDSPVVTINGEVLRPGDYPMSQGMTVSKLIGLAGGLRRSAYLESADLASYTVQEGRRVSLNKTDVPLRQVLAGDKSADFALKPGDVLSIRRITGWSDIGATVTLGGEVEHPGVYGIVTGEKLSSVIKRAGGFRDEAYPYAAVLERQQVAELNELARQRMIRRIQETPLTVARANPTSNQSTDSTQMALERQRQAILENLRSAPPNGRLVIEITTDTSSWENTPKDIELRTGDRIVIPKRPAFVLASGQVNNPVAISYMPGKKFSWYFNKAGGASSAGDKKKTYVLRADGSVIPCSQGWMSSGCGEVRMRPGDAIYVPEKITGGSQVWQNILMTAQVMTAITLPLALAGVI